MRCDRNDQFINNFGLNPVNCVVTEFGQSVVSEQLLKIRNGATVEVVEVFVCIGRSWVFHKLDIDALNGFEVRHGQKAVAAAAAAAGAVTHDASSSQYKNYLEHTKSVKRRRK